MSIKYAVYDNDTGIILRSGTCVEKDLASQALDKTQSVQQIDKRATFSNITHKIDKTQQGSGFVLVKQTKGKNHVTV